MVHDEGLGALHKTLDRLQDELLDVGYPRSGKRRELDILKDITNIERLIEDHEQYVGEAEP